LEAFEAIKNAGVSPPPSMAHDALQNVDALFRGDGVSLPFAVILDYIYGIAAYNAWRSEPGDGFNEMEAYRNEHYARRSATLDGIYCTDVPPGLDPNDSDDSSGSKDHNYIPSRPRKCYTATRRNVLDETMDQLNMFLMRISGITPVMAAEREQKVIELEERVAQESSRSKVMEWRNRLSLL
jgi:hypothetical protein